MKLTKEVKMEEIEDVKEGIALLRGLIILLTTEIDDLTSPTWERILARERAHLDTLIRGLKPEAL